LFFEKRESVLGKIIDMNKSAGTFYISETIKQPMQKLKKGVPGPVEGKVHATRRHADGPLHLLQQGAYLHQICF